MKKESKKENGFRTETLKLLSIPFGKFEVGGFEVEIRKASSTSGNYFTSYVELKNSKFLSDSCLGHPTFREEDWVGVDTAHSYNDKQDESQKLLDVLSQISHVISRYKESIREDV